MAERLTVCIDSHLLDNGEMVKEYDLNSNIKFNQFSVMDIPNAVYDKLGMLEDIMERLGINFVEDLEDEVRSLRVDKYIYKKDRDTWKRACELACEKIVDMLGDCPIETVNWQQDDNWCEENCDKHEKLLCWDRYFYQQAKTEGNDEK